MQTLILNFTYSIFPVAVVVALGFLLRQWKPIDPKQVAHLAFNIMLPALIFKDVFTSDLPLGGSLKMLGLVLALLSILLLLGWILGGLLKLDFSNRAAVTISIAFMNCGNLGLSVNEFALGGESLSWAGIFFIAVAVVTIVVGVYLAESGHRSMTVAISQIFRLPIIYAIAAAFILRGFQVEIPTVLMRPIELTASGAIPIMLLVLGVQIAETGIPKAWRLVWLTSGIRLVISPLIALGLAYIIGLQQLPLKVAVLQAGMPIAVLNGVIATEYDLEPDLVASTILVSTLLSPLTLSILISTLQLI